MFQISKDSKSIVKEDSIVDQPARNSELTNYDENFDDQVASVMAKPRNSVATGA